MVALLRQRDFALLWIAGLISALGDWVLFVALPFYVYQRTGSTLATGTTFIAQILPPLLLGSSTTGLAWCWRPMLSSACGRFWRQAAQQRQNNLIGHVGLCLSRRHSRY
jgi:hypothetical protein